MSDHERERKRDPRSPTPTSEAVVRVMQGNKGKDTKPELLLRRVLRQIDVRGYRLHWPIPGNPDLAFPGRRICVFVHGCFWHRCPSCKLHVPKTHTDYWTSKFYKTMARDVRKQAQLRLMGWTVIIVWECELKKDAMYVAYKIKSVVEAHSKGTRQG